MTASLPPEGPHPASPQPDSPEPAFSGSASPPPIEQTAAGRFARLAAATLPRAARARYREEWLADLDGARELGMSRAAVLAGVIFAAATFDRDTGSGVEMTEQTRLLRQAQRGVALLLVALLVLFGHWVGTANIAVLVQASGASGVVAGMLAVVGAVSLWGAMAVAVLGLAILLVAAVRAQTALAKFAILGGIVSVVAAVLATSRGDLFPLMLPAILLAMASAFCALVVIVSTPRPLRSAHVESPRARRIPVAAALAFALLIVIAVGVLDLMVLNPLAKVPGAPLDEIYATLAERDGFVFGMHVAAVTVWAVFWAVLAVALPVLASLGTALGRFLTVRRLVVVAMILLTLTVFFKFFAGFSIGMSIADSYFTSGGDGSLTSALLGQAGQLAAVAAALLVVWPRPLAPARSVPVHA